MHVLPPLGIKTILNFVHNLGHSLAADQDASPVLLFNEGKTISSGDRGVESTHGNSELLGGRRGGGRRLHSQVPETGSQIGVGVIN